MTEHVKGTTYKALQLWGWVYDGSAIPNWVSYNCHMMILEALQLCIVDAQLNSLHSGCQLYVESFF